MVRIYFFLHMLSEILFSLSYQKLDNSTLLSVLTDFLMSYLHLSLTPFFKILLLFRLFLGNQPKPLMTQVPDVKMVYTGESVSFECKVQLSSGWRYQWSKDGKQLPNNNSSRFNIRHATSLNNGTYECSAMRDKTMYNTSHSDGRTIHVSGELKVIALY